MNPLIVLRSGYITKLKLKVHITYKKTRSVTLLVFFVAIILCQIVLWSLLAIFNSFIL
jgi:hypothetical protein